MLPNYYYWSVAALRKGQLNKERRANRRGSKTIQSIDNKDEVNRREGKRNATDVIYDFVLF